MQTRLPSPPARRADFSRHGIRPPKAHGWLSAGLLLLLTSPLTAAPPTTQPTPRPPLTDANPRDTIPYLASDELQGRCIDLPAINQAADFIAGQYAADGLQPLPGQPDYFERFDYPIHSQLTPQTTCTINNKPASLHQDFIPLIISAEKPYAGPVVFVGYGITDPQSGYDDYAGVDAKRKIALCMRFEPVDATGKSRLATAPDKYSPHAYFSAKAHEAQLHGAVALLVVNPPNPSGSPGLDVLPPFVARASEIADIPIIQIRQTLADQLLKSAGTPDLPTLRARIDHDFKPQSLDLPGSSVSGDVQVKQTTAHIKNVIACLPGIQSDQYVVVGAHYDHLGLGELGHTLGGNGKIFHGADDNASGTAAVLELAHRFGTSGIKPQRTIIFVSFTAEEEGLIGSEYLVHHSPVPLDKIVAMLNMDMVGRLTNQQLFVGGQGTAKDLDGVLTDAQTRTKSPLKLKSMGRGGLGPSDHMAFAIQHVPVLFFFTGLHADYHRPTDTADKINYDGIDEIVDLSKAVIEDLTRLPPEPYLTEADKDSFTIYGAGSFNPASVGIGSGSGDQRRAVLGIIPHFGDDNTRPGVLIDGVTPGTPAESAGLKAGDLLTQFADMKLTNLMDLNTALVNSKPGDKVTVTYIRDGKPASVTVTLAEHKD